MQNTGANQLSHTASLLPIFGNVLRLCVKGLSHPYLNRLHLNTQAFPVTSPLCGGVMFRHLFSIGRRNTISRQKERKQAGGTQIDWRWTKKGSMHFCAKEHHASHLPVRTGVLLQADNSRVSRHSKPKWLLFHILTFCCPRTACQSKLLSQLSTRLGSKAQVPRAVFDLIATQLTGTSNAAVTFSACAPRHFCYL
jgi:hypothetical protein